MAADDKESGERRQSRSLERDRGQRRRQHRVDSPSVPKQRRKRSRSPGVEEKQRHKNSAEKHEDSEGHELSNKNTEGMSEEDNGREVARKNGVEDDEKAGARKSIKEDRKVELHSSGDSSGDAYSDSESDRGRKKKSRSRNSKSRKSKRKHYRHFRSESEQDESQTEGTSGESSEASEDEHRRAKRRKRLKQKEKDELKRKEEQRWKKEKKRKMKEKERELEKRKKKKETVEKRAKDPITKSWDKYGITEELAVGTKRLEFSAWLAEVKKVNLETLTNLEEKDMFKQYVEDYKRGNFPSKKYYNIDLYHRRKVTKERMKGMRDMVNKQSECTGFKYEEQRRLELIAERAKMKETEFDKVERTTMETGMVCNEEQHYVVGDCFEGANMLGEGSNNEHVLDPKHKIFLSHSGAQKQFVDHLYEALKVCGHFPFFDRKSLPKGERFAKLILEASQQCKMLIVVVSNEYFMSKWPMIELSAFVKAHESHRGSINGPKILPLFYGLSVRDLDNEGMRKKWFKQWKTFAKVDPKKRIVVSDWENALDVLKSFHGHPYDWSSKEEVAYIKKIVSDVCISIVPEKKWDDSHVQGKSSICKVIDEKIEGIGISENHHVKVVGIYGVGGIGKTTTCKLLCNERLSECKGRVCHVEFPSDPSQLDSTKLFQKVLRNLIGKSEEFTQHLDEGQCKDILHKTLSKQRTFLALDNILDNHQSIEVAKMFLKLPYHKEGFVVVTTRSRGLLEFLKIEEDACFEMPNLEKKDAIDLFLYHAAPNQKEFNGEEMRSIMTCVSRCFFSKGNGEGHHYLPLALQALGLQLDCCTKNPCDWVKHLPEVKDFNYFLEENPVFGILRSSFDFLPPNYQTLFMDVGCFYKTQRSYGFLWLIEWLCIAHNQNEEEIARQLDHLKRKGLLQNVDLGSEEIGMHDLYLEFAKLEAKGSFSHSQNFRERMWLYMEDGDVRRLYRELEGGPWHNLIRLCIKGSQDLNGIVGQVGGMEDLEWGYFSNVEVLQLFELHWGLGGLNLKALKRLRILELHNVSGIDRVEDLEKLNHLTHFTWWTPSRSILKGGTIASFRLGQLPSSLKRLEISVENVVLGSDSLARCCNLSQLCLLGIEVHSLDLSNCQSLKSVVVSVIQKLQTLLCPYSPCNLHSLSVSNCRDLVDVPGIHCLISLKKLYIRDCEKWKVPSLLALTELQVLSIEDEHRVVVSPKDFFPHQLRELRWRLSRSNEGAVNLTGFTQLEVLDLSISDGLTSLAELGVLHALRCLNLNYCKHLLRLPNLSMSRNLQELELDGCSTLELHEKDIQMLSELPSLQPVKFSRFGEDRKFQLDLVKGKVLVYLSLAWAPS